MPKVRVAVPASSLGLGPGMDVIGLALSLHNTIELSTHAESSFSLQAKGEGNYPASTQHPAMRAADFLFQKANYTPAGLSLSVNAAIPADAGLGDIAALIIGGLVAANNVITAPLNREQLAEMAVELCRELNVPPAAAINSLFGGLTVVSAGTTLIHRRIDVPAQKLVLALPEVPGYREKIATLPKSGDLSFHISQTALLIEGFRKNDTRLIGQIMREPENDPRIALIPGYKDAGEAARKAGAFAVALCGNGPTFIALTQVNQKLIETEIQKVFSDAGVKVRTWQLNMDTQGVALSVSN